MYQPRPCKFGADCRNLANGNCRFFHPEQPFPQGQQQPRNDGSNTGPWSGNNRGRPGGGGPDRDQRRPRDQGQDGPGMWGPKPFPSGGMGGMGGMGGGSRPPKEEGPQGQVCKMFQLGLECKYGQKCHRTHGFLAKSPDDMRRLMFLRNLPVHPLSKLTKLVQEGKNFYAMRNGHCVNIFDFNLQTKQLGDTYTYQFPDPNAKYSYYDHKGEYFYYAGINSDMPYFDFGFFNIVKQQKYHTALAHNQAVTGVAHFMENVVMTTSINGELKVWLVEGNQLKIHPTAPGELKSKFNPENAKLSLFFIDISTVKGSKITAIGTSDGRLLFFIGEGFDYKPVKISEQYCNVFEVRYTTRQEVPYALVLACNHNLTKSVILEIDLTNFGIVLLTEMNTTPDQPKNSIHFFEIVHDYLMVVSKNGIVTIHAYPSPPPCAKVGAIFHQNEVASIVEATELMNTSNIQVKTMFILEKKTDQREGSLGIYLLK